MSPITTHLRLSQLAEHIEDVINDSFCQTTFWVLADVIDYKLHEQKGHHYFCLAEKDPKTHSVIAKLSAAAWKGSGGASIRAFEGATGQQFRSNIHVLANVSVQYSPAYGLKLILNEVDPTYTIGILEQHRRDTLQRLLASCPDYIHLDGNIYRTRNNTLPLPKVVQRIAVVTSSGAEGYRDFRETIAANRFGYAIQLDPWFTSVQGEANADGVCKQLVDIYLSKIPYDAVVIIRGGGSQADLLLFEQFALARTVAKFPIPVITGIGHTVNQSIVDLMAHTPVKTPSIAAEFIIDHNRQFEEAVTGMQQRILIRAQQQVAGHQQALSGLRSTVVNSGMAAVSAAKEGLDRQYRAVVQTGRKILSDHEGLLRESMGKLLLRPRIITAAKQCALEVTIGQIGSGARRLIAGQQGSIEHHIAVHRILNPVNILRRGFAVIYRDGEIVTGAAGIHPDDEVSIRFYESKLGALIKTKTDLDGSIANL